MEEQRLVGGNASGEVVRIGDSVRKPWTPSSASVHGLLDALLVAGVDVPRPEGRDAEGRQRMEFVPGTIADAAALDLVDLARVGGMVRAIHDASAGIPLDQASCWEVLLPSPTEPELICHNDLAPWNLVVGDRWVFIDWDAAGPSTRAWDLAYAAVAFTLNDPGAAPHDAAARLAAFVHGYDPDPALRARLLSCLAARPRAMADHLARSYAEGAEPWASMHATGHGAHWLAVAGFVARHDDDWRRAIAPRAPL